MSGERIVVVDDNPANLKLMKLVLSGVGYDVRTASSAEEALELVRVWAPRLVVTDIRLPHLDGLEMTRRLKARAASRHIPVLAVTAYPTRWARDDAIRAGCDGYVTKPLNAVELQALVASLLATASVGESVQTARREQPWPPSAARIGAGRRVLLADDDPVSLKLNTRRLEKVGFEVVAVTDGNEALQTARELQPDIVLSDVLMPVIDGFALCLAMRLDPALAHIPVVLHSVSYVEEHDRALTVKVGASAYVYKLDFPAIVNALLDCLENRVAPPPLEPREVLEAQRMQRVTHQLERQALLNTQLERRSAVERTRLAVLAGIADALTASLDVEPALHGIFVSFLEACGVGHGVLFLASHDGSHAQIGFGWQTASALHDALQDVVGRSLGRQTLCLAPGDLPAQASRLLPPRVRWLVLVPIALGEQRFGSLLLALEEETPPQEEFLAFAETVAIQIAQALALTRSVRQLEDEREKLRQAQKLEAVGQLAGGVAHDFNNMLSAILGYSELLLGRLGSTDPLREYVEEIFRAGERAAVLTGHLLAFSRRQVVQVRRLDVNEVVRGVEKMLRRLIGEDIDLAVRLRPDAGHVMADSGQIEQVIMNLVVNARDAMPRGGRLTIETAPRVGPDNRPYVALMVSDTGTGMDAAVKQRLFEPFFTTKELGRGTGLGLPTVQSIVTRFEGHIEVESEPGRGTCFTVLLPRTEEVREAAPAAPRSSAMPGGSERILVAEDENLVRHLVCKILQQLGYTVMGARDGAEATAIFEREEGAFDMLISDLVMPGLSGFELADRLRARHGELKVLFLSGYTGHTVPSHGLPPQTPFLEKPLTPHALAAKIREVLDAV